MGEEGPSSDRYVQIATSEIHAVQLRHLLTEREYSIVEPSPVPANKTIAGTTQWVGSWRGETITVAWDWSVVGGIVVMLSQKEIRSNIELLAADGSREPHCLAQIRLYHWIESLPWREMAAGRLPKHE